jgi:hypothetical protein
MVEARLAGLAAAGGRTPFEGLAAVDALQHRLDLRRNPLGPEFLWDAAEPKLAHRIFIHSLPHRHKILQAAASGHAPMHVRGMKDVLGLDEEPA